MIKGIIFDCFGVLASDGWLPFKNKYFGHDSKLFEEAGELNRQVDTGLKSHSEFIARIAEMAGVTEQKVVYYLEHNVPDEDLLGFITWELKPKYKIGMLSNAGGNWLNDIFTSDQISLFDAVVLSYDTGMVKPQPEIYKLGALKLGVKANECIFIDDQERYCVGAESVGMHAIKYDNLLQLKTDLIAILSQL